MIAIVILAILAAIAYPSYTKFIIDTRMQAGMKILENVAIAQDRFYLLRRTYSDSLADLGIIEVPENVQIDFSPVEIVFNVPTMTTQPSSSPSLDPTVANIKSDWVAVLTPRANGRLANQLRIAINANGDRWMETDANCNNNWTNHCCRYGRGNTDCNAARPTTDCTNLDWQEWLSTKPDLNDLSCP